MTNIKRMTGKDAAYMIPYLQAIVDGHQVRHNFTKGGDCTLEMPDNWGEDRFYIIDKDSPEHQPRVFHPESLTTKIPSVLTVREEMAVRSAQTYIAERTTYNPAMIARYASELADYLAKDLERLGKR